VTPITTPGRFAGMSLLIVEDNPVVRIALGAVAARLGIAAAHAESGEAAIEALRSFRFDALLIDLQLPGLDGIATTRAIRQAAAPWSTVPVIGMTATVGPEDDARSTAAGMARLLRKPVQSQALAAAIATFAIPRQR
jgi:CheY-like chemotaxis protein